MYYYRFRLSLREKDGTRFDGGKLYLQRGAEPVNSGVLPDIRGVYTFDKKCRQIDALCLFHAKIKIVQYMARNRFLVCC
ncbi:MAG TPA: hypothetical protein GXZ32_01175 [Clostridiales bacterium]|nr:hypothetical protein [Clostridiales bacterium]